MNAKKFFAKLKEKNIKDAEYRYSFNKAFSLEVFQGELNSYTTNSTSLINVDAIIDDKLIMGNTENTSNKGIDQLINNLLESAKYTSKKGALIYKTKSKYKRYNHYNKELNKVSTQDKIDLIFLIEKKIKSMDSRISEVQVSYEEVERIREYQNTAGIKIKNKSNSYSIGTYVIIKNKEETKSHFEVYSDNNYSTFNIDEFVKEAVDKTIAKLNPTQLKSSKYKVVFSPEATSSLLEYYVSQLNAELILKNSSWFKDKVNTLVANKKVTIFEKPLKRDSYFVSSDDQGVPTKNANLIKKGVLLTYLHNLETAKAFNVEPTGHASLTGSKMGISAHTALYLKPTKLTKEELLKKVDNGIYIDELEGLHAGMNAQNGNFSLKTEGFLIKDGKIDKPLNMMTINGNLFDIFKNIKAISENIEFIKKGAYAPCIYLNKIAISF